MIFLDDEESEQKEEPDEKKEEPDDNVGVTDEEKKVEADQKEDQVTGFEITNKNHCDRDIVLSIISGFEARKHDKIYLHHSDFSFFFQTLSRIESCKQILFSGSAEFS